MSTSTSQHHTICTGPGAILTPINRQRATPLQSAHAAIAAPTRSRLTYWQMTLVVLLAGAALLLVLLGLLAVPTATSRIDAPVPVPSAQQAPPPPPVTLGLA